METLGYSVKALYVDDGKTAEAVLTEALMTGGYDCIMIGAGLRVVPPYFLLFEKLINVVHRHAPASTKLCFNSNPRYGRSCKAMGLERRGGLPPHIFSMGFFRHRGNSP